MLTQSSIERKSGVLLVLVVLSLPLCGITLGQEYWFESYQKSLDLIEAGRLEEASSRLKELLEMHPTPQQGLRISGNQLMTFLPYFQRARIEFQRGQYQLAEKSLDISEAFGVIQSNKRAVKELQRMRGELHALKTER